MAHEDAGERRDNILLLILIAPAAAVFFAFWLLPIGRLMVLGGSGEKGIATYFDILINERYLTVLMITAALAASVTAVTLLISIISGVFLARSHFPGRSALIAILTLPLAFPGVVIGFMVIMLGGRQGVIGSLTNWATGSRYVFAYTFTGLFIGYVYFSIPRVILTVMASAEKLDVNLEEAAKSLGASEWRVFCDVTIPGLLPALMSSGAICFATSMGAFGTAFTLNVGIPVLPMLIYTEFTLNANIAVAAALSVILGLMTWLVLAAARSVAGNTVAAAA
jgi:putative spermidine/putrescine transport system permease protein